MPEGRTVSSAAIDRDANKNQNPTLNIRFCISGGPFPLTSQPAHQKRCRAGQADRKNHQTKGGAIIFLGDSGIAALAFSRGPNLPVQAAPCCA